VPAMRESAPRMFAEVTSAVGPDHPNVALSHHALGMAFYQQGDYAEAERELKEGVRMQRAIFGPGAPQAAKGLMVLSAARMRAGDLEGARAAIDEAIVSYEQGKRTKGLADAIEQRGNLFHLGRDLAHARADFERALELKVSLLGPDHPGIAITTTNLATLLMDEKRYDDAVAMARRTVAIYEKAGTVGTRRAWALDELVMALVRAGRGREALAPAEEALAYLGSADESTLAHHELWHGQALEAVRREPARARALAASARARCAGGKVDRNVCGMIEEVLARRRRSR
jgi:tetratricopeptide (TPR) repeat protein